MRSLRRVFITLIVLIPSAFAVAAAAPPVKPPAKPAPVTPSAPAVPAPELPKPNPADTKVTMSFEKADIGGVIKFLSSSSGIPIVCDPELKGQCTIICLKQIPLTDAFEVVSAALRVRGYAMVGNLDSKVIRVITLKRAVSAGMDVRSGDDPQTGDTMVTQIIPLQYISAVKLKDDLKPLVSDDQASLVATATTNTLIVTDNAGNVHRISRIVQELDKDTSDVIEVEIYPCKYSSADSLADTLVKVFRLDKPSVAPAPQPGRPEGGQPQPQVKVDDGLISLKGEIRIASDARTNSLIISASRAKIDLILNTIKKLDVDTEPEVQAKTFQLQYADAVLVADQLSKLFEQPQGGAGGTERRTPYYYYGGMPSPTEKTAYAGLKRNVIVADVRTNSVIVTATEQNMRAFESMIKQLDAPKVLSEVTRVFPLKYAKAPELAETLNRLFRGEYRRPGSFFDMFFYGMDRQSDQGGPLSNLKNITVVAEDKTNTLLVTGPPQAFAMVDQLVQQLDKRTGQVFIEVAIVDVTLDNDTKFGVEWNWNSASTLPDGTPKHSAGTDFGLAGETSGLKYSVISNNLKVLLHALQRKSNVKVYSTPTITTADNVEAKISIGRDEPFVTSEIETTAGSFRRTVDFKNVAVSLTVTPHINGTSDVISLDVYQTINEIIERQTELDAPVIANREARTSISVRDGQTIVIGGIIKENRERLTRAVPLISEIPLIGELFKSRQWRNQKSELMVFLTPHVLRDDASVDQITNEAREKLSEPPPK